KTRASAAREKGLAPLAEWLLQEADDDVQAMAARYISEEKQVLTAEEALAGALDIVAETVADDAAIRQWLREWTLKHGVLVSRAQDAARESVYEAYYDYREPVRKVP